MKCPSLLPLFTLSTNLFSSLAHMSVQGSVCYYYMSVCEHKTVFADDGAGGSYWGTKI